MGPRQRHLELFLLIKGKNQIGSYPSNIKILLLLASKIGWGEGGVPPKIERITIRGELAGMSLGCFITLFGHYISGMLKGAVS